MKKSIGSTLVLCLMVIALVIPTMAFGQETDEVLSIGFVDKQGAPLRKASTTLPERIVLDGTGASKSIVVSTVGLTQDVKVSASSGLEVSPQVIAADAGEAVLTITNHSTLNHQSGRIILRSGDIRLRVNVEAMGTPLPVKDLSQNPVYSGGKDKQKTFEGFAPGPEGFTVELRAKTDVGSQRVEPFGVSGEGVGFKGYVGSSGIGLMNSRDVFVSEKGMSNPSNGGTFYNTDGEYHTYRYAVTGDERVFVYRDGIAIDTMRVADLALQPEWSTGNGPVVANLIRNGDFEGESDYNASAGITDRIEGWDVYPYDQWNSTQSISSEERSNEVDQNNHVLEIHRYMWEGGWAAAEISQIVDVAPNEVYSFSCLAKGGIRSNGEQLGTIRIQDLQNDGNRVNLPVTSDSYQTYASDFTTQATTRQVRVTFLLERAAWGASVSAFKIDDVKLTGVSRTQAPRVGFDNNSGDIAYFNFDATGAYAPAFASLTSSVDTLRIDGTGASGTFTVDASNLTGDITLTATSGFEVSPSTLPANSSGATVTVKNLSTLAATTGKVVMRSGDKRKTVRLVGTGTPLPVKDLSQNPVYSGGKDKQKTFEGFAPGPEGFTVELRAKTDVGSQRVEPFGVSGEGVGFKGYVGSSGIGLMNSRDVFVSEKGMSNPSNGGTFYNTDGEYHTYRYAVTGDERVFVYRDGIAIDTMRVADLALQPEWSTGNGPVVANLIRNGDFEGESDYNASAGITDRIEGWDVYPYDQWNSTQSISSEERSNEVDQNNHVLEIHRYMWEGGWAAAEISQIVDVAPNEVYSFSCLAKGGIRSNGEQLGTIRIQDLQNDGNRVNLPVTSDSYQTYASDFTTQATTRQVRVTFLLERAAWGASVSAFKIDDVKLTGVSRTHAPLVGFDNNSGDIAYFNFDATGAYAPAFASLTSSVDTLVIDGTGATNVFSVNSENLTGDISLMATHGFAVSPTTIKAGKKNVTVTVTNLATLKRQTGRVIMRAGDMRTYVNLVGIGTALPVKDLSQNPVYAGGDDEYVEFQDFEPSADGYSLEIKAKVDASGRYINPFAITEQGVGFKGYVNSNSMGLYNGKGVFVSEKGISNPANGGTFYNTDGLQHTYRYAVTSDKRVFVYRDGLPLDTMRIADLALQPEWAVATGPVARNLIKNGDFEGEYNYNSSRSITDRIEGWDVYPYDQYNSYQDISREERSNEVDQNNHVLEIHRYMWEGGWAAAEISQIVDVAPNEVYSFSCLAKGGIRSNGDQLGSIRIQDLQNDANRVTMTVNSDSYKTYAADFESQANTQQVRVTFMLERAAWGASVSAFKIDDVKMKGFSRLSDQKVGFENLDADVEYFNYDASGAYAPQLPGLDVAEITDAIQTATDQVGNLRVRTRDGQMQVFGVEAHSRVLVYAADGRQVIALPDVAGDTGFVLPGKGVYIVAVIKDGRKHVLKAKY